MNAETILAPMGTLAGLTFFVLLFVPARRVTRRSSSQDSASGDIPGGTSNRNYVALLEMPVLFFVICLMLFVTNRVDTCFSGLPGFMSGCAQYTARSISPMTG